MKESLRAQYGENKRLAAGDYDASLAGSPSLRAENLPDGKTKVRPLYDGEKREVMVFDEFNVHPEKESERKIIDWERTYFLTKYLLHLIGVSFAPGAFFCGTITV